MDTHIQQDTKSDIHHSQQSTQHQAAKPVIPKVIIGQNKYPLKSPTQTLKRRNRSSGRPHQQHQSTRNPQLFSPPLPKNRSKKSYGFHRNAGCRQSRSCTCFTASPSNSRSTSRFSFLRLSHSIHPNSAIDTKNMVVDVARFSPFPI